MIPARWLDYEPPGLCRWAAAGVIASVVGTGVSIFSKMQESDYEKSIARNQAVIDHQKANEEAAAGQRRAITETRKTELVQSRARALAAASGTDAASPSTVDIEGDIAQQGGYNMMTALYEGMTRERAANTQADIDLFKANRISAAAPLDAAGTLFSGAARLAENKSLLKLFGE